MTELPKVVSERLRAVSPGTSPNAEIAAGTEHLDANLLSAFAEQALPVGERDGVLTHLARCIDCREIVALALPEDLAITAAENPAAGESLRLRPISAQPERRRFASRLFAWSNLGWAGMAAAVAVVATGVLLQSKRHDEPKTVAVDSSVVSAVSSARTATLALKETVPASMDEPAQSAILPTKRATERLTGSSQPAQTAALAAQNAENQAEKKAEKNYKYSAPAETPEDNLTARAESPAILRAKPALPEQDAVANAVQPTAPVPMPENAKMQALDSIKSRAAVGASMSTVAEPAAVWTVTSGALRRSFDGGQTWQNVLQADHALQCYADRGQDVWAGGVTGTVFHSADGGLTWKQVRPSSHGEVLGSDVSHMAVRESGEIDIATANEVWVSSDGGQSWAKTSAKK